GASGEDFASILRSLGYRMDRKPRPAAEAAIAPTEALAAAPDAIADAAPAVETPFEPAVGESAEPQPDVSSRLLLPEPEFVPAGVAPSLQTSIQAPPRAAEPAEPTTAPIESAATEAKAAEEFAFIEVWRPAGRSERRPHRPRRPHRQQQTQVAATDGATATSA